MILHKDKTGYIKGHLKDDYWWIEEFVVYPKFRGKNLAKILAIHLPRKSKLLAQPLFNMAGPHITKESLINFYKKLGFTQTEDEVGNTIMSRGI